MTPTFIRFIAAAGMILSSSMSFAQSSASANVAATIVSPIVVSHTEALSFNNVSVGSTTNSKSKKRTTTPSGIKASTSFSIDDGSASVFSISLPADTISCFSGGNKLTVQNFSSTRLRSQLQGTQNFSIEAVLRISNKSVDELNCSAQSFDIIINYN